MTDKVRPISKCYELANFHQTIAKLSNTVSEKIKDLQTKYSDSIKRTNDDGSIEFNDQESYDSYSADLKNIISEEIEVPDFTISMTNLSYCESVVPVDLVVLQKFLTK